jgi:hypothetical protein
MVMAAGVIGDEVSHKNIKRKSSAIFDQAK